MLYVPLYRASTLSSAASSFAIADDAQVEADDQMIGFSKITKDLQSRFTALMFLQRNNLIKIWSDKKKLTDIATLVKENKWRPISHKMGSACANIVWHGLPEDTRLAVYEDTTTPTIMPWKRTLEDPNDRVIVGPFQADVISGNFKAVETEGSEVRSTTTIEGKTVNFSSKYAAHPGAEYFLKPSKEGMYTLQDAMGLTTEMQQTMEALGLTWRKVEPSASSPITAPAPLVAILNRASTLELGKTVKIDPTQWADVRIENLTVQHVVEADGTHFQPVVTVGFANTKRWFVVPAEPVESLNFAIVTAIRSHSGVAPEDMKHSTIIKDPNKTKIFKFLHSRQKIPMLFAQSNDVTDLERHHMIYEAFSRSFSHDGAQYRVVNDALHICKPQNPDVHKVRRILVECGQDWVADALFDIRGSWDASEIGVVEDQGQLNATPDGECRVKRHEGTDEAVWQATLALWKEYGKSVSFL